MSATYLSIPLRTRLKAFKLNGKTKLGHGWHEPPYDTTKTHKENAHCKWFWVPGQTIQTGLVSGCSHHGCWGGQPFKIEGSSTELRWCEDLRGYFRNVTPAHEIIRLGHTGWYTDNHYDESCHGLVMQLPSRNRQESWLCGISDPNNQNAGMVAWKQCEWADNKADAARWSDDLARHYAESSREDYA